MCSVSRLCDRDWAVQFSKGHGYRPFSDISTDLARFASYVLFMRFFVEVIGYEDTHLIGSSGDEITCGWVPRRAVGVFLIVRFTAPFVEHWILLVVALLVAVADVVGTLG